jgi:hypothetical protein
MAKNKKTPAKKAPAQKAAPAAKAKKEKAPWIRADGTIDWTQVGFGTGLSDREIAQSTGKPIPTVYSARCALGIPSHLGTPPPAARVRRAIRAKPQEQRATLAKAELKRAAQEDAGQLTLPGMDALVALRQEVESAAALVQDLSTMRTEAEAELEHRAREFADANADFLSRIAQGRKGGASS